jgi:hypothetical protein
MMTLSHCWPRLRLLALSVLLTAVIAGCGGEPDVELPTTYPVTGVVEDQDGRPFPGGSVQFQSREDRSVTALGEIGPDGTFTLSLHMEGNELPGTVAGPHEVTVIPPDDGSQTAVPVTLAQTYEVTPGRNHPTIKVP